MNRKLLLVVAFLTGCARLPNRNFALHVIAQPDAPVQIVSITPDTSNLLAHVFIKNTTDKRVLDFDVSVAIVECANPSQPSHANRSQPMLRHAALEHCHQVILGDRGLWSRMSKRKSRRYYLPGKGQNN
jgi:hypothetical protein